MRSLSGISRLLARAEDRLAEIAGLATFAIMCIVMVDVVTRYILSIPIAWSHDVIQHYLMVAGFFLALPHTLHHHGHVSIDLLQPMMPLRLRHALETLGYGLATPLCGLITWQAWLRLADGWQKNEVLAGEFGWPTWPSMALVVVGAAALTLRMLYRTLGHLVSTIAGRTLVEVPPPPENQRPLETDEPRAPA